MCRIEEKAYIDSQGRRTVFSEIIHCEKGRRTRKLCPEPRTHSSEYYQSQENGTYNSCDALLKDPRHRAAVEVVPKGAEDRTILRQAEQHALLKAAVQAVEKDSEPSINTNQAPRPSIKRSAGMTADQAAEQKRLLAAEAINMQLERSRAEHIEKEERQRVLARRKRTSGNKAVQKPEIIIQLSSSARGDQRDHVIRLERKGRALPVTKIPNSGVEESTSSEEEQLSTTVHSRRAYESKSPQYLDTQAAQPIGNTSGQSLRPAPVTQNFVEVPYHSIDIEAFNYSKVAPGMYDVHEESILIDPRIGAEQIRSLQNLTQQQRRHTITKAEGQGPLVVAERHQAGQSTPQYDDPRIRTWLLPVKGFHMRQIELDVRCFLDPGASVTEVQGSSTSRLVTTCGGSRAMIIKTLVELMRRPREANGDLTLIVKRRITLWVQTENLAEQHGWQIGKEKFLWDDTPPPIVPFNTARGFLGKGGVAEVHEVVCQGSSRTMARKKVMLPRRKVDAIRERQRIQQEVSNMMCLGHLHIVKVLGCYLEKEGNADSICALLVPVGDNDLNYFLHEECNPVSAEQKGWINSWFGCLASALAYMHSLGIHHEDIKPQNIIHRAHTVYFTDFSSSRRLESGQDTSTDSPASGTRKFAAPELYSPDGIMKRHGSQTDIYSLGLVYIQMWAVVCGGNLDTMDAYLFGERQEAKLYNRVDHKFAEYFSNLLSSAYWMDSMLATDRKSRPLAKHLSQLLMKVPGADDCNCSEPLPKTLMPRRLEQLSAQRAQARRTMTQRLVERDHENLTRFDPRSTHRTSMKIPSAASDPIQRRHSEQEIQTAKSTAKRVRHDSHKGKLGMPHLGNTAQIISTQGDGISLEQRTQPYLQEPSDSLTSEDDDADWEILPA